MPMSAVTFRCPRCRKRYVWMLEAGGRGGMQVCLDCMRGYVPVSRPRIEEHW